uniref:Uncharacterized protein n=1 Tax=Timema tahoe TaxID=61484 RepID=A0A7R9ICH2_9NEOP|nr:unnamed protein product [Timema tahoe]
MSWCLRFDWWQVTFDHFDIKHFRCTMYSNTGFANQPMYRGDREQFIPKNRYWSNQQHNQNGFEPNQNGLISNKMKQPGENLRKPLWDSNSLQPFLKNFYVPHANSLDRSSDDIDKYRSSKEITVKGNNVPQPSQYFEEGNFPDYVMQEIM